MYIVLTLLEKGIHLAHRDGR